VSDDTATVSAGRPSKYDPLFAAQAGKLCELGATDMEIAEFLNVALSTFYLWRHTHPDFSEAVRAGKERADDRVERALYNRAVGYTFETEKVFQFQGEIVRAPTREHVPPDPGAAMNWLKNRKPDTWRDKIDHTIGNPDGSPLQERSPREIAMGILAAVRAAQADGGE